MAEEQEKTAPFDTEVLQSGWARRSEALPRCHAWLAVGAKTDLGRVRENNEDKFELMEPAEPSVLASKGRVYAVADGMGGHSAGQVAAELALNYFVRAYYEDMSPDIERSLYRAVRTANSYVVEVARNVAGRSGMGATLTAAVVRNDDLFVAQVGDSRCYLLRNGELQQITEDHSWVAEQVRAGAMSLDEAEQSPFRNVITRSMGGGTDVEPDVTAVQIHRGDRFLLCSDGLSGMVPDGEMARILAHGAPSVAAWDLIDRANQYGGRDNITALVIEVMDVVPWTQEDGPGSETSGGEPPPDPPTATEVIPLTEDEGEGDRPAEGIPTAARPGLRGLSWFGKNR